MWVHGTFLELSPLLFLFLNRISSNQLYFHLIMIIMHVSWLDGQIILLLRWPLITPGNNLPGIASQFANAFLYDCYTRYLLCSSFPS